jgi:hypothetical protein
VKNDSTSYVLELQGVRKKGMASYIRDKMRDLNLDIICFQETIEGFL